MSTRYVWEEWEVNPIIEKDSNSQPVVGDLDYVSATTDYQNSISGYWWFLKKPFLIQMPLNRPYTTDTDIWFVTDDLDGAAHAGHPYAWYVKAGGTIKRVEESHGSITDIVIKGSENWQVTGYERGDKKTDTLSTNNSNRYPKDGYKNGYWYIYKGADTIDPAAVSYDASTVVAGEIVTVTISPSSGNKYGGTITYSVETNTDEAGWEPYIETTATTFTFTIPEDAVSWRVRVKVRDNMGFSSSTYVYGNNAADDPTTVIHPSIFAVIPEDKNLGFVSTSSIVSYLVTTDDNVDYTISVSLNGTDIYSATESPKARTLTIPDENWEALSLEQVHTVVMLITQGDKQIERTFRFKKFLYSYDTLYDLFTGIAKATRIKRAYNKQLVAAEFPNEILKISGIKEETSPSYIDVVLSYVEGGVIIVTQVDGDIYGADIDPSGTTKITVDFTGVYTVQGYIGDSPSSSATVTIVEAGETKTVTLQWTQLMVMTLPGSSVTAVNNTNVVTGMSGESGAAELYLPSAGVWELSATNEDYNFAAANSSTVDGYGTYTSELDFVSPVFEENNWETIARVVKEGKAESYWNVGDCKAVILNGILGE